MTTIMTEADRAIAERAAQGLPPTITDPETLRKVAMLVSLPLNGSTPLLAPKKRGAKVVAR